MDNGKLRDIFLKCCHSERWAEALVASSPFMNREELFTEARKIWFEECGREDWLAAFSAHPKIGDMDSLEKKYGATKSWSGSEQAGVDAASPDTLHALAKGNQQYEEKFGYIFIVCATGKSADEMLQMLKDRLHNTPDKEILIAMKEQHKITELRLSKILASPGLFKPPKDLRHQ